VSFLNIHHQIYHSKVLHFECKVYLHASCDKLNRCYKLKVTLLLWIQWKPIPVTGQSKRGQTKKKERKKEIHEGVGGGGDSAFLTSPVEWGKKTAIITSVSRYNFVIWIMETAFSLRCTKRIITNNSYHFSRPTVVTSTLNIYQYTIHPSTKWNHFNYTCLKYFWSHINLMVT
jgi:hypothetical protein